MDNLNREDELSYTIELEIVWKNGYKVQNEIRNYFI